ncbi:hypothetical protein [Roseibium suaedae]|uniref:Uncharacterized protein n=1 Tax=Roseibium suaedae TaxID=735517 RepID=A0A1M7PD71_9HYPH|nr:hypothetical protein [Roseibium suaedae]SHN14866.1 hypothetical protein SAMN05444272_4316 [Roseibium suaedae]
MARFPAYQKNILALGQLLAKAATDPEAQRRLKSDPAGELRRAGLPEETVSLFTFKVSVTKAGEKEPVVLPWRLNQEKLTRQDPDYLLSIAETFMGDVTRPNSTHLESLREERHPRQLN